MNRKKRLMSRFNVRPQLGNLRCYHVHYILDQILNNVYIEMHMLLFQMWFDLKINIILCLYMKSH